MYSGDAVGSLLPRLLPNAGDPIQTRQRVHQFPRAWDPEFHRLPSLRMTAGSLPEVTRLLLKVTDMRLVLNYSPPPLSSGSASVDSANCRLKII